MKKFLVWGLCLCAVLLAFRVSIAEAAELEVLTCGEASGADRAAAPGEHPGRDHPAGDADLCAQ